MDTSRHGKQYHPKPFNLGCTKLYRGQTNTVPPLDSRNLMREGEREKEKEEKRGGRERKEGGEGAFKPSSPPIV